MNVPVLPTPALQKGPEKRGLKYLNVPLRGNSTVYVFVIWFSFLVYSVLSSKKKINRIKINDKKEFSPIKITKSQLMFR